MYMLSFAIPIYLQTYGNFYGHLEQQCHFFGKLPRFGLKTLLRRHLWTVFLGINFVSILFIYVELNPELYLEKKLQG